ncbi:dienelactone hydrolase family protein [Angustibacter aerolatus]
MTTIVLFHSVLGLRQGVSDAAERLRAAGHEVHTPDLLDGAVFDAYEPAMANWQPQGEAINERALQAVADLPDGFVVAGFSAGSGVATFVATRRAVSALLQLSGENPLEWFGEGAAFPPGMDSQIHQMSDDPFHDGPEVLAQAIADVEAGGGTCESFEYPGSAHLFTDPSLPDEYDAEATELLWSRVLPFVAAHG